MNKPSGKTLPLIRNRVCLRSSRDTKGRGKLDRLHLNLRYIKSVWACLLDCRTHLLAA